MAVLIPFIFNLPASSVMALSGYAAFYASTWEEYHTGVLYLDYISGPVEGAWLVVLASLATFWFGPTLWDMQIAAGWRLNDLVPVIFILGSISTAVTSFRHSMKHQTVATLLKQWIPVGLYYTSCALLSSVTPPSLATWFVFLCGFPACFRISSTIIAYVTKSPLKTCSFYPLEFIPVAIFILNQIVNNAIWTLCFKVSVGVSLCVYLSTMLRVVADICSHLDIHCLSIKKKK